ncbi:MAG: hypothetical protein WD894_01170 [Pirellulales bacterium]
MLPRKHPRLSAMIAGLVLFALPAQTQACWLFNCFGHQSRTTFYAPAVAAAPACSPCAQQTVRYVPQTAYRPLVTTMPVTALRPVMATDPCTGCPTTAMHPTTTYVQRTVLMPYTTYRPVIQTSLFAPAFAAPMVSAAACPTGVCAPAASTTYYQPAVAPAISQPGCCAQSAAPTFGQISTTTMTPSAGTPVYSGAAGTLPAGDQRKTFSDGNGASTEERTNNGANGNSNGSGGSLTDPSALDPTPDVKKNAAKSEATSLPELRDPLNRTTSTTTGRAYAVAWNANKPVSAETKVPKLDDSGWEAAR